MRDKPDTEIPNVAAAWAKVVDPLTRAACFSATRQNGHAWKKALATADAIPSPVNLWRKP